jgi:MSHA biogenesis protein MshQ
VTINPLMLGQGCYQLRLDFSALLYRIALMLLLIGVPAQVSAAWDKTFIEGINAYGSNATIGFASSAYLYNAPNNGKLPALRVFQTQKACVAANGNNKAKSCKDTTPLAVLPNDRLAFSQCTSASSTNIGPPSFSTPSISVPQGEYANVSLSGGSDKTLKFTTPDGIYKLKSLSASSGRLELSSGQYWIETLSINNGVTLVFPASGTVTFFIKNNYTHQDLNLIGAPERFVIYNYGDFTLNGSARLNAYVVAQGTATLEGSARLTGAITANQVRLNGGASVTFADTVARVTTVPNCTLTTPPAAFHMQFGQSLSGSNTVLFDKPFEAGVTPLVFAMATVSKTNSNSDGPATVTVSNISATGFSWTQIEPPSPGNRYVKSVPMPEVHWIAVSPGTHELSNGTKLIAGSVQINQALIGSNSPYTQVTLPAGQNVVLNQLQSQNNNCWLTSTSQFTANGIEFALDSSEVRTGNTRCQPGDIANSQLKNETLAYMALSQGTGSINLNGDNVKFHFGNGQTGTGSSVIDLANQCRYTTALMGFDGIPTLVAGKTARRGGDGGWLRRCQLSATELSMVVDEDTYRDSDRRHVWENYSFVALEKINDSLSCFNDDFNRADIGDDWAHKVLGSSLAPSIINGRLRLTSAIGNQAASSTYQRLFPAAENLVEIEFDYFAWSSQAGTGADGIAIILSDASITPQPGSFGGALGYAQRNNGTPGFAGGWLGIALDEYGNFSNANEGKVGGPGFRAQAVAIRGSANTSYRYLTGTNANLDPRIDVRSTANAAPNHRYKIVIDSRVSGTAMVSVLRDTQNRGNPADYVELVAPFNALSFSGQAPVPENFYVSFTGSTGGSNNNHEMDDFKVCALKSEPVGDQVHHFEFDYSLSPLTCKAETMTVRACKNAVCDLFTDPVRASLSPHPIANGGWYFEGNNTNAVSFTNGLAQVDLHHHVTTPMTIGVTSSDPSTVAGSDTLCRRGSGALSKANCSITFADSGFVFDVPDKLANKETADISIKAVKKSDTSQQCVPSFAGVSKTLNFWSSYISPSTLISPQPVTVNGRVIGQQANTATAIGLNFDANGESKFKLNYPDAGQVELNATYTGSGDDAGLMMQGSDQFVSFPVGLCITPKEPAALCPSDYASCKAYKKAGETFDLVIQAKAWQNDVDLDYCDNLNTPNFAQNKIVLGHELIAPAGNQLGSLSNSLYSQVAAINNSNTVSQSVSEVGVFNFSAKAPLGYLASNFYDIPLASSASIGRFVPASFEVIQSSITAACGAFSYMDQGFGVGYTLAAKNITGVTTQNYIGAFAKASISLAGENANDGVDLSSRLTTANIPNAAWDKGEALMSGSDASYFNRLSAPQVDGPFESLAIGLKVNDNDGGLALIAAADMHAGSTAMPCDSLCDAKLLGSTNNPTKLRHGRVVMDNTYGPENETLRMPVYAQYWSAGNWVNNLADGCSTLSPSLDGSEQYSPALIPGQTVLRGPALLTLFQGGQELTWNNAGTVDYRGEVRAPLTVAPWLKWYWNWDSSSPNILADPRASAFFGRYRGHDRIIYWRETQ